MRRYRNSLQSIADNHFYPIHIHYACFKKREQNCSFKIFSCFWKAYIFCYCKCMCPCCTNIQKSCFEIVEKRNSNRNQWILLLSSSKLSWLSSSKHEQSVISLFSIRRGGRLFSWLIVCNRRCPVLEMFLLCRLSVRVIFSGFGFGKCKALAFGKIKFSFDDFHILIYCRQEI